MSKTKSKKPSKFVIDQHKYLQNWINKNIENPIPHFDYNVNHVHTTNPEIAKDSVKHFGFDSQDARDVSGAMIDLLAERIILYGEMNKIEFEKMPTQIFNETSQAGLDDDEAMAVTAQKLREITDHNELINLFKKWYSYDTNQDIIEALPNQIWSLWTQIQYNYATW